jgi:hypothetical protein
MIKQDLIEAGFNALCRNDRGTGSPGKLDAAFNQQTFHQLADAEG